MQSSAQTWIYNSPFRARVARRLAFAASLSLLTGWVGNLAAQTTAPGTIGNPHAALPVTPPTRTPAAMAPIAANPAGTVSSRPQTAAVSYGDGLLDVRANNSSLNAILREVARETGMKLTGSVADQRVFGNYGPASPATVLATLLDGTGSNMLLREAADLAPAELILTPRTAGPSPPSASTDEGNSGLGPVERSDAPANAPTGDLSRQQRMGGASGAFGQGTPIGFPNQLQTNQADGQNAGINGLSTDAGAANGTNANGNGITRSSTGTVPAANANGDPKTPEQVYQLLQQLRQQSIQEQNGKQQ